MIYRQTCPQILKAIEKANYPLLICHEKPDGDTLGASLALSHFLHSQAKPHKHFCLDKPAEYFNYLSGIENIISDCDRIILSEHDLIIIFDCGDIRRTGLAEEILANKDKLTLINIDHHQTNTFYGHLNLIIPTASSTSEIIYKFFEHSKIELDKYMATNLLTGIVTDTMNFTNAATSQACLEISAKLLNQGARIAQIIGHLTQNKSLASLKIWGKILSRLEIEPQFNFAHTIITLDDLDKEQIPKEELDGLANFLSLLQDAEFILLMTEEAENFIKGSLRTTKDLIDVSMVASTFGGGGHKKAAGFKIDINTIPNPTDWKNYIINAIIEKLKTNNQELKLK
jgi:bifunctional oligoribonuclease and PAP phosphatase NrnA